MKIMVSFLSVLLIFLGITHFFSKFIWPTKGTGYSLVLIIAGIFILAMSMINQLLIGTERIFLILMGLLVIGVAILPFFPAFLASIPREGFLYAGIVLLIGVVGLLYAFIGIA